MNIKPQVITWELACWRGTSIDKLVSGLGILHCRQSAKGHNGQVLVRMQQGLGVKERTSVVAVVISVE